MIHEQEKKRTDVWSHSVNPKTREPAKKLEDNI